MVRNGESPPCVSMRINELARDLEVKAKAITDYLPEIGIEDKKSHSSSIEGELIEKLKPHFQQLVEPAPAPTAPPVTVSAPEPASSPAGASAEKVKAPPPRDVAAEAPFTVARKVVSAAPAEPTPGPKRPTPLRPPVRTHG